MGRTIAWAWLIAGTLDLLSAYVWAAIDGGDLAGILPTVASGPFGDNVSGGATGQLLGLLTHFSIMLVMVTVYVVASRRVPALNRNWIAAGLLYGLVLWGVMYWLVLPMRFEGYDGPSGAWPITKQLISHCLLVGLPIAWIARRERTA